MFPVVFHPAAFRLCEHSSRRLSSFSFPLFLVALRPPRLPCPKFKSRPPTPAHAHPPAFIDISRDALQPPRPTSHASRSGSSATAGSMQAGSPRLPNRTCPPACGATNDAPEPACVHDSPWVDVHRPPRRRAR
ncbi:hypothetical protein MSAN_00941500 [Mycena sanguinolenta]|uniref:Uncharacterized protein n=1 Tax=Mycena sanguinolenta TaxID=230812 RepID=A0A8H6YYX8_9AGAR|nr:hypothetical protein MSAN_00941500 [Mycena sanguinolenta]